MWRNYKVREILGLSSTDAKRKRIEAAIVSTQNKVEAVKKLSARPFGFGDQNLIRLVAWFALHLLPSVTLYSLITITNSP